MRSVFSRRGFCLLFLVFISTACGVTQPPMEGDSEDSQPRTVVLDAGVFYAESRLDLDRLDVCDGLDNDGDGRTDEDAICRYIADTVFLIDVSGSMELYMEELKTSLRTQLQVFDGSLHRFGAIAFPGEDSTGIFGQIALSRSSAFTAELDMLTAGGGGLENTLGNLFDLAHPDDLLSIDWRSAAFPKIVLITDEGTAMSTVSIETVAQVIRDCEIGLCDSLRAQGQNPAIDVWIITKENLFGEYLPAIGSEKRLLRLDWGYDQAEMDKLIAGVTVSLQR